MLSSLVVADNDSQVVRVEIATILWDDTSTDEKFPFKKTYSLIEEAVKLNKDDDFSQETDFFLLCFQDPTTSFQMHWMLIK